VFHEHPGQRKTHKPENPGSATYWIWPWENKSLTKQEWKQLFHRVFRRMKLDLIGDGHTSTQLFSVFFKWQLFFSYKLWMWLWGYRLVRINYLCLCLLEIVVPGPPNFPQRLYLFLNQSHLCSFLLRINCNHMPLLNLEGETSHPWLTVLLSNTRARHRLFKKLDAYSQNCMVVIKCNLESSVFIKLKA